MPFYFKASFDKANRTSADSFRGPGLYEGIRTLERVRTEAGVLVTSDIHEVWQAGPAGDVLDMIQIPALLCRQTDLIVAAAETGRAINIKKGQFMAPEDMAYALAKARSEGPRHIALTERGSTFGYHDLVVDMRSIAVMRSFEVPVYFDATHSVQKPGGGRGSSSGRPEFIAVLAQAAVAAGATGVFLEVHDDPSNALSDGPNCLPLGELERLMERLLRIRGAL